MKITEELLRKYSAGVCTEEEKKAVEKWMDQKETSLYNQPIPEMPGSEKKAIWSKVQQLSPQLQSEGSTGNTITLNNRVMRFAAAAIILFTVGFFGYRAYLGKQLTNTEQLIALKTIKTERGQKRTVTLSDGSTIRMNYETQIKAPEKFEIDQRVVYLTGHAHFDIARDTKRPFIIYTEDSKTQVLGTSFDINTREAGETEIIVTSGKVAFSQKEKSDNMVMLTINDRAVLQRDSKIATSEVDAKKRTSWKENRLLFENLSLEEIIEIIEPWYDITVTVKKGDLLVGNYRFIADNPSLEGLLKRMSFMAKFDYSIKGKQVTIY